jgi:hypothetical protein
MGLFDFLKRKNNSFFDGLKDNAVENALQNSKSTSKPKALEDLEKSIKEDNDFIDNLIDGIVSKNSDISEDELLKLQKERNKNLVEKYGEDIGNKLFRKEFFIGMSYEMLVEVKPKHDKKVSNITNGKETIKLYYGIKKNRLGNDSYNFEVTLKEGLVVGWKDLSTIGRRES